MIKGAKGITLRLVPVLVTAIAMAGAQGQSIPSAPAPLAAPSLTIDRIAAEPDSPEMDERSTSIRWSPDGSRLAWTRLVRPVKHPPAPSAKSPQREIWTQSAPAGDPSLGIGTAAALLVSADKVSASLRGTDAPPPVFQDEDELEANPFLLHDFAWSPDVGTPTLLLVGRVSIALLNPSSGAYRILVPPPSGIRSEADDIETATFSPDGRRVSFVRDHSLWLVSTTGKDTKPRPFVRSQTGGMLEGEADFTYRNELHMPQAYWWSPDSRRIAYLETDDRRVAKYTLPSGEGEGREIAYPKPGGSIPSVRVLIRSPGSDASTVAIRLPAPPASARDVYLCRVAWLPDGRHLAVERLDRYQQTLELFVADALTGQSRLLLTESDKYWLNLSDILYFFHDGKRFLWSSERTTGYRHLYLYDLRGHELAQLTQGEWEVTSLNKVDEPSGRIYFTATEKSALERHLYCITVQPGTASAGAAEPKRITSAPGTHSALFAPDAAAHPERFADLYSSQTTPLQLRVFDAPAMAADGMVQNAETGSHSQPGELLPLLPVQFQAVKLHMGGDANSLLIRPANFDPGRKYPVVLYLAGGPGEQLVRDAWGGAPGLWMQSMAQQGFLVFGMDTHGSAGRGHFFEEPIHLRLGAQEMADIRDGVSFLNSLGYADLDRLGVAGWGYGGSLVIHALLDRPIVFKAGFAGAPVTEWRLYDATFGERYLGSVVAHQDGWNASTALDNARFYRGSLMIAQPTSDEFVHLENLIALQDRLLDAGRSADVLLLGDRGHHLDDPLTRQVYYRAMTDFFLKHL